MSDGPSTRNRRITKPCFRTCSTYVSRSQAPLCLYARRMIANHAEGAIGLLRYSLGGDRPSQTAHHALSRKLIQAIRLGAQHNKSGISLVAPPTLTSWLHRLPPMLHKL
jgi:hypothetical protein